MKIINITIVFLILISGLLMRLYIVFFNPPFNAPDEKAHFNYVNFLVKNRKLPIRHKDVENGYDYTFVYPPVYYLLLSPILHITKYLNLNTSATVKILRLSSVLIWLINFLLLYNILKKYKSNLFIYVFIYGFFSFLPTYLFISSSINPDNLMVLWGTILYWYLIKKPVNKFSFKMAIILALAMITKYTGLFLIFLTMFYIYFEYLHKRISKGNFIKQIFFTAIFIFIVIAPFIIRNMYVYQSLGGFGKRADITFSLNEILYNTERAIWYFIVSFWAVGGVFNNYIFLPILSKWLSIFFIFISIYLILRHYLNKKRIKYIDTFLLIFITVLISTLAVLLIGIMFATSGGPGGQGRYIFVLLIPILVNFGLVMSKISFIQKHILETSFLLILGLFYYSFSYLNFIFK